MRKVECKMKHWILAGIERHIHAALSSLCSHVGWPTGGGGGGCKRKPLKQFFLIFLFKQDLTLAIKRDYFAEVFFKRAQNQLFFTAIQNSVKNSAIGTYLSLSSQGGGEHVSLWKCFIADLVCESRHMKNNIFILQCFRMIDKFLKMRSCTELYRVLKISFSSCLAWTISG